MSVITTVYNRLANDPWLRSNLAPNQIDPDFPGIYERWVVEDAPMPYIVMSWNFGTGNHWAKQNAFVILDIFTQGQSSVLAEQIQNRIIELFDRHMEHNDREGLVRFHLSRHGDVPEPEPNVVHWDVEFNVIYWRRHDIQLINERMDS